jgi:hypothetical protein
MRRISLIILLVGLIASSASASTYAIATGNWTDPCIWDDGSVPPYEIPIDDGDEIKIGSTADVTVTVNSNVGNYSITKIDTANGSTLYVTDGEETPGYIGGGKEWHIGDSGMVSGDSDIGYLTQDGGTVDITDSGKLFVGYKSGGDGTYTMSGGLLTGDSGRLYVGCGNVDGSIGKFIVVGDDPNILLYNTVYVASASSTGDDDVGTATMEFDLDADGAVSKMRAVKFAIDAGGGGTANLVVVVTGITVANVDIVLMESTGTSDVAGLFDTLNGGSAAEGTFIQLGTNWYKLTYVYDEAGDSEDNDIALVWVPEPATMALMALGLIAIRRKK